MSIRTKEKYQYVHIFLHPNMNWCSSLIDMFADPKNGFNFQEHFFVILSGPLYHWFTENHLGGQIMQSMRMSSNDIKETCLKKN